MAEVEADRSNWVRTPQEPHHTFSCRVQLLCKVRLWYKSISTIDITQQFTRCMNAQCETAGMQCCLQELTEEEEEECA